MDERFNIYKKLRECWWILQRIKKFLMALISVTASICDMNPSLFEFINMRKIVIKVKKEVNP